MHVTCPHCLNKAHSTSRNDLNDEKTIADLYCTCLNPDGSGSFVTQLAFQRWLNPPAQTTAQLALNLLINLPKEDRQALIESVFKFR